MARLSSLLTVLGALTALATANKPVDRHQKPLLSDDYVCQHPPYKITMVSKSPLVIYIKDFITPDERAHLQLITQVSSSFSSPAQLFNH